MQMQLLSVQWRHTRTGGPMSCIILSTPSASITQLSGNLFGVGQGASLPGVLDCMPFGTSFHRLNSLLYFSFTGAPRAKGTYQSNICTWECVVVMSGADRCADIYYKSTNMPAVVSPEITCRTYLQQRLTPEECISGRWL